MVDIRQDTETVKEEFDAISTPTQVFIWTLVSLGVLLGLVLGGAVGYGVAVEEVDGRECIEHQDTLYCAAEEMPAEPEPEPGPPPEQPEQPEQPPPPPEGEVEAPPE